MSRRFYTSDHLEVGEYLLTGPEAHHLHSVCRIEPGEAVTLFNGDGREYVAEVLSVGKKSTQLLVQSIHETNRESSNRLWVASAIPKGDRLDFLIEKLTELGVARFIPLITERSVVRPKPEVVEKYQRMVIEASKQCGRNRLLHVEPLQSWEQFAKRADLPERKCVLHPTAPERFAVAHDCVIAIGPEGGFTEAEAQTAGWQPVRLGGTILRIETAAIAAASVSYLPL